MSINIRSVSDQAARQHGILTRALLDRSEVTRGQRRGLIRRGFMEPVGTGVYRLTGAPQTGAQRILIACLDARGVASHRTAAALHGIGGFEVDGPIEILVRAGHRNARSTKAQIRTTNWLPSNDLTEVDAIPVTSVARTVFSLAALVPALPLDRVDEAVDDAVSRGLATEKWMWWQLEETRKRGRNGVRALEQVLSERAGTGVTESWLERTTLRILADAGLPLPLCQKRVAPDGAFVARVDFLYPDQRVVIEVLGHRWHRSRQQVTADAERRRELTMLGYEVHEFTYDEIVRTPEKLIALVESVLSRPMSRPGITAAS